MNRSPYCTPTNSHRPVSRMIQVLIQCARECFMRRVSWWISASEADRASMDYRCGSNGNVSFLPIAQSSLRHRRGSLPESRKRAILSIDRMTLTEFEISTDDSCLTKFSALVFLYIYTYVRIRKKFRKKSLSLVFSTRRRRKRRREGGKEENDNPLGV